MKYSCPHCGFKDILEAFSDPDEDLEMEIEFDEQVLVTCPDCDETFDSLCLEEHYGWFS